MTDLGCGFYKTDDHSTCFYITRFIMENRLPPTAEFVDFVRRSMAAEQFKELMD
jgi:hypothetical protein